VDWIYRPTIPNFFILGNNLSHFDKYHKHTFVLSIHSYFNFGMFYRYFNALFVTDLHYATLKYSILQNGTILANYYIILSPIFSTPLNILSTVLLDISTY
jgi:hypothetical protein